LDKINEFTAKKEEKDEKKISFTGFIFGINDIFHN